MHFSFLAWATCDSIDQDLLNRLYANISSNPPHRGSIQSQPTADIPNFITQSPTQPIHLA